jgi:hypothetical protein
MDSIDDHLLILREGRLDAQNGTTLESLKKIFDTIGVAKPEHLVMHFHGGLVNRQDGIGVASNLSPLYQRAGTYPIFFIWESGWREILEQQLPTIFKEDIFRRVLTRVAQFAKAKIDKVMETAVSMSTDELLLPRETSIRAELNEPTDTREPFAGLDPAVLKETDQLTEEERSQFIEKLKADPVLEVIGQEIVNGMSGTEEEISETAPKAATISGSTQTLMDLDVLRQITKVGDTSKGEPRAVFSTVMLAVRCAMILKRVVGRFIERRDHGFYLTIVEEILRAFYVGNAGKFLWDGMKRETVDAFGSTTDCGGSQFLVFLENLWKSGTKPKLTLVGHSAGAIYVCHLLQEAQKRELPEDLTFNVVLIAPACDFTLLAQALKAASNRVNALRIFGMGDDLERADAIVPGIYPSSLLYFVSGVLEDESDKPLVGMARFYNGEYINGEFPEIDYVRNSVIFKNKNTLIWAQSSGGEGLSCDMNSHGGWAQAATTLKSLLFILEKGYGDVTT